MPTAAKVVAALFFAALGYFSADLAKPLLPEGTRTQWMNEVVALFGLLMGWNVVGRRVGDGVRASLGYGITASLLATVWSVGAFALADMLERSMDRRYRGVMDALQDMVRLFSEFGLLIMVPSIFVAIVVGGAVGGWLSEWANRRWN
jgi:hypothetical protein